MSEEVLIDRRFRGPPASANGGYTCGVLAEALDAAAAEVNLRRPPPLDAPLRIERAGDRAVLVDDEGPIADAGPLDRVELELPEPPPLDTARAADADYPYYDDHWFPGCFVCGPDRSEHDGLRIFPGPIGEGAMMACVWTPDHDLAGPDGSVGQRVVWAALDCPSGLTAHHFSPDETTMVLARLRGQVAGRVGAGEPHIVAGWAKGRDGRKHQSATGIWSAEGRPLAWADALWIELRS